MALKDPRLRTEYEVHIETSQTPTIPYGGRVTCNVVWARPMGSSGVELLGCSGEE